MKRLLMLLVLVALLAGACTYGGSDAATQGVVDQQQAIYLRNQPVPMFNYSVPRDVLLQIYRQVTEGRNTYSVVTSMTGAPIYECPSYGVPIPADTQLTNPLKLASTASAQATALEQAEPNGLFTGKNTDGTWLICIRSNGDAGVLYTEQKVTTFSWPVRYDKELGRYVEIETAPSTMVLNLRRP